MSPRKITVPRAKSSTSAMLGVKISAQSGVRLSPTGASATVEHTTGARARGSAGQP